MGGFGKDAVDDEMNPSFFSFFCPTKKGQQSFGGIKIQSPQVIAVKHEQKQKGRREQWGIKQEALICAFETSVIEDLQKRDCNLLMTCFQGGEDVSRQC